MEHYGKYIDSKISWIGNIPEGWKVKKLKRAFQFVTGFTPPTGKSEYYENGQHSWINISDLKQKFISESENLITDKAISDYEPEIVPEGSLLYSFKLSVGKVAFLTKPAYTNEAIFSVKPIEGLSLKFFYYSLPLQLIMNANENIYGAKILNQELIKNADILLPPAQEQDSIANYLDHKIAEIDALITQKEQLIEHYQEEKSVIIDLAVLKGINPNSKFKDSGNKWLGTIPEGWDTKRLKYETYKIGDGIHTTPAYLNGTETFFINGVNLSNKKICITENTLSVPIEEYEKYKIDLAIGSVLISLNGTVGNLAIYNGEKVVFGKSVAFIEAKEKIYNQFLYYVLQTQYILNFFENSFSGTTIKNLSLHTLRNTPIPLPPISEQKAIVQHIEIEIMRIDAKISKTQRIIELQKEYRSALISEVVTGKVKVSHLFSKGIA
jgi:type I restriction enzyme S subunit